MIRGWRLVKSAHREAAFDGEGARRFGGRWNSPGTRVVYVAESRALAALELLVHLHRSEILAAYCIIPVDIPEQLVSVVRPEELPPTWREYPSPAANKAVGDSWAVELASAVLAVPSAVVEGEAIFLLNPNHPQFRDIIIGNAEPFAYDERLLKPR